MERARFLAGMAAAATGLPRVGAAQGLVPLRLAEAIGWTLGEGYFAEKGGFFTQAGLDVTITNLANGGAITAAVVGGAVDVAMTNVGSMASAYSHGLPLALIAPGIAVAGDARPTTAVCVLTASPIRTPRDLAGKTLCVSTLHDLQQAAVMNWLAKTGADPSATNYVEIPVSAQVTALRAGRVDAAALTEPWLAQARPEVRLLGAPYASLGKEILISGFIARRDWIAANGPTVQKFVTAVRATARWGNTHEQAMLTMLEDLSQIEHGLTSRMGRPILGESLNPSMIQPIIDVTAHYGYLDHDFPASELIATS